MKKHFYTLTTCSLKIKNNFWTLRPGDLRDEEESVITTELNQPCLFIAGNKSLMSLWHCAHRKCQLIEKEDWRIEPHSSYVNTHIRTAPHQESRRKTKTVCIFHKKGNSHHSSLCFLCFGMYQTLTGWTKDGNYEFSSIILSIYMGCFSRIQDYYIMKC